MHIISKLCRLNRFHLNLYLEVIFFTKELELQIHTDS